MTTGPTWFDAATFLLKAVAVLGCLASLFAFFGNRRNTSPRSLGKQFLHSAAFLLIIYLLHLVSEASVRVPNGRLVYRLECLHSRKGGKRPLGDESEDSRNPCYNASDHVLSNETGSYQEGSINGYGSASAICPTFTDETDSSSAIEQYISASRDCGHARGGACSLTQPCTPCELSRRDEFHNSPHGWSRCQACLARNRFGECNFVEGAGPYCFREAGGLEVVPCKRCCTEGIPMFDEDGACY